MVAAIAFPSRPSYLRAKADGTLERIARGHCPFCSRVLWLNGWAKRLFLGLSLRRSRCPGCRVDFTLLPLFVAPAKWYGYEDIDRALVFVTDPKYPSLHAALDDWDNRRIDRIEDDEKKPGPSRSTVARWHRDLAESGCAHPWQSRIVSEVIRNQADHPVASQLPPEDTTHHRVVGLVLALTALGALLIRLSDDLRGLCAIALGLWCIEVRYRSRCFANPYLDGRVIPGPSPRVDWTLSQPPAYLPRSRKSGGDP